MLLAKLLDMGPPCDVLALAMDPPDITNIQRTILVLKEVTFMENNIVFPISIEYEILNPWPTIS